MPFQDTEIAPAQNRIARAKAARSLMYTEEGLSIAEADELQGRSRDLAILQEAQTFIIEFMITGGDVSPNLIKQTKKNFETQGVTPTDDHKIGDIPLAQYLENGHASIVDFVTSSVRNYLPQKDQDNDVYLNRIKVASVQIIKLLDQGLSHRQIADLLSTHYQSIHTNQEWDQESQSYRFLQQAITQGLGGEEESNEQALLEKFDRETAARVSKMGTIAIEELAKKRKS